MVITGLRSRNSLPPRLSHWGLSALGLGIKPKGFAAALGEHPVKAGTRRGRISGAGPMNPNLGLGKGWREGQSL